MATTAPGRNISVIWFSLLLALILMIIPLPEILRFARPEWLGMFLIYWAMALPQRVSIGVAWFVGILMDALSGTTLGVHAFAYALIVFLVARFHLQLRQYPLWQQALTILSLVMIVQLILLLASSMPHQWQVWMPAVTSTLVWPVVYALLRKTRRTFQVS
ncbi:MAG: rod shape-determining protein MreD [Methylophaga sp.]|nr:rod shape-determining protein MreD [Methylophaga sp.]